MNFKIALAALLIISGGSYVSHAQSKANTLKAVKVDAAKAFENKVAAYEKEKDASRSAALLAEMQKEMSEGMTAAKTEVSIADAKGDTEASAKLMQKFNIRTMAVNEVMKADKNKMSVLSAMKRYAQTL